MTDYSLILILSFLLPLVFSFEKQIFFIKKIKKVLITSLGVGIPYLIWDSIFTKNKIWDFSKGKVSEIKVFTLPIEEVLFFFIVPYALIFIYEVINFYLPGKKLHINYRIFLFLSIILLLVVISFYPRRYTAFQSLVTSLLFFIIWLSKAKLFSSKNFWSFILISFIPFLVINYFLTSIPIVWYDNSENLNIKILTIPIEDFFYHFTYSSFILLTYSQIDESL